MLRAGSYVLPNFSEMSRFRPQCVGNLRLSEVLGRILELRFELSERFCVLGLKLGEEILVEVENGSDRGIGEEGCEVRSHLCDAAQYGTSARESRTLARA